MSITQRRSGATKPVETRNSVEDRPHMAGVAVREDDLESVKGIRAIAILFRGMAIVLVILAALQAFLAATESVPMSPGVVVAEVVRLLIFAGLLWGAGDLAVLAVKSHHDLRATRILTARLAHMIRQVGEADGKLRPASETTRADREI
jgi:hypothetical protein